LGILRHAKEQIFSSHLQQAARNNVHVFMQEGKENQT
jgi:hypothetical protein